jgi:hypothetical protein
MFWMHYSPEIFLFGTELTKAIAASDQGPTDNGSSKGVSDLPRHRLGVREPIPTSHGMRIQAASAARAPPMYCNETDGVDEPDLSQMIVRTTPGAATRRPGRKA